MTAPAVTMRFRVRKLEEERDNTIEITLHPVSVADAGAITFWLKEPSPLALGKIYDVTFTEIEP